MKKSEKCVQGDSSIPTPDKGPLESESSISKQIVIDKINKNEMLNRLFDSINSSFATSTAFLSSAPGTLTAVELRKMCKIHQGIYSLISDIQKLGIKHP